MEKHVWRNTKIQDRMIENVGTCAKVNDCSPYHLKSPTTDCDPHSDLNKIVCIYHHGSNQQSMTSWIDIVLIQTLLTFVKIITTPI